MYRVAWSEQKYPSVKAPANCTLLPSTVSVSTLRLNFPIKHALQMLRNLFDTGYFTYTTSIAENMREATVSCQILTSEKSRREAGWYLTCYIPLSPAHRFVAVNSHQHTCTTGYHMWLHGKMKWHMYLFYLTHYTFLEECLILKCEKGFLESSSGVSGELLCMPSMFYSVPSENQLQGENIRPLSLAGEAKAAHWF